MGILPERQCCVVALFVPRRRENKDFALSAARIARCKVVGIDRRVGRDPAQIEDARRADNLRQRCCFYRRPACYEMRLSVDVANRGQMRDTRLIACPNIALDLDFGMPSEVGTDRYAGVDDLYGPDFREKLWS